MHTNSIFCFEVHQSLCHGTKSSGSLLSTDPIHISSVSFFLFFLLIFGNNSYIIYFDCNIESYVPIVERSAILSVESNDDTVSKNILSDGQQLYLVPNDDTVSKNTVGIISMCPCR